MFRVWYTENGERKFKRVNTLEAANNLRTLLRRSARNLTDIEIEEVDAEEMEVTTAPVGVRLTLRDVEFLCRKVRGEELYKVYIKNIDQSGFKGSEVVVLEYIKKAYESYRGTKEEVEERIAEIKAKIDGIYTNPVGTDLERIVAEVIEDAGLTTTRKKALKMLMSRVEKLPYYNELIGVIADRLLFKKWFAGVGTEREIRSESYGVGDLSFTPQPRFIDLTAQLLGDRQRSLEEFLGELGEELTQ